MANQSDDSVSSSRRKFTQSVAATLLAVPVASAISGAQNSNSANQTSDTARPQSSPQTASSVPQAIDRGLRTHIPPIIISGGSLTLRSALDIPLTGPGHQHNGMKFRSETYTGSALLKDIARVRVYTENSLKYNQDDFTYTEAQRCQLRLWLQKLKADETWDAADLDPTKYHAMLRGNPFTLELDRPLHGRKKAKQNPIRPFKYEHPGYGGSADSRFRIVQWQTVDGSSPGLPELHSGVLDPDPDEGSESFTFFVSFFD